MSPTNPMSLEAAQALAEQVKWNADGLVTAVAQDAEQGDVLMLAWMNREALIETLTQRRGVYWSRSRNQLWRKGESSGQGQEVVEVLLDCDGDAILLKVRQAGVACHTGRRSCFHRAPIEAAWKPVTPVLVDPKLMYGSNAKR